MTVKIEELKDLECDNSTYKDEFDFVFAKTTALRENLGTDVSMKLND